MGVVDGAGGLAGSPLMGMRAVTTVGAVLLALGAAQAQESGPEDFGHEQPQAVADSPGGLVVGSGPIQATYYPVAGLLADLLSDETMLTIEATGGSIENLVRLHVADLDLAVARSDRVMQAVMGEGPFSPYGPDPDLRALSVLFPEPLTLIARTDAAITSVSDLPGKRLNIGPPAAASRGVLVALLDALGITPQDLAGVSQIDITDQMDALCGGEVDVVAVLSPHPSITVADMLADCAVDLVSIDPAALEVLLEEHPAFAAFSLPPGTYPGQPNPIEMVGPVALLMGTSDLEPDIVRMINERLIVSIDRWQASHPVLRAMSLDGLAGDGLAAPRHRALTGG